MDLDAINQSLFDEYLRITGLSSRFLFPAWFAMMTRRAIGNLHEHPAAAVATWGRLTKPEQRVYLHAFLRAQPPAKWPDLQLVIDRAYAAAGDEGRLQAALDGVDLGERAA